MNYYYTMSNKTRKLKTPSLKDDLYFRKLHTNLRRTRKNIRYVVEDDNTNNMLIGGILLSLFTLIPAGIFYYKYQSYEKKSGYLNDFLLHERLFKQFNDRID